MGKLAGAGVASWAVGTGLVALLGDLFWQHRGYAVVLGLLVGTVMLAVFAAVGHVLRVPEVRQLVATTRRLSGRLRRRRPGATS
jgi:putative peptidoglycan lipid II flippase